MYKPSFKLRDDQITIGELIIDRSVEDRVAQLLISLSKLDSHQQVHANIDTILSVAESTFDHMYTSDEYDKMRAEYPAIKRDCKDFMDELHKARRTHRCHPQYKEAMKGFHWYNRAMDIGAQKVGSATWIETYIHLYDSATHAYQILSDLADFRERNRDRLGEWDNRYRSNFSTEAEVQKRRFSQAVQVYQECVRNGSKNSALNRFITDIMEIYNVNRADAKRMATEYSNSVNDLNDTLNLAKPVKVTLTTISLTKENLDTVIKAIDKIKSKEHQALYRISIMRKFSTLMRQSMEGTSSTDELNEFEKVVSEEDLEVHTTTVSKYWTKLKELVTVADSKIDSLCIVWPMEEYKQLVDDANENIDIEGVSSIDDSNVKEFMEEAAKLLLTGEHTVEDKRTFLDGLKEDIESLSEAALDDDTKAVFYQLYGALQSGDNSTISKLFDSLSELMKDHLKCSGKSIPVQTPKSIMQSVINLARTEVGIIGKGAKDAINAVVDVARTVTTSIRVKVCDILDSKAEKDLMSFEESRYHKTMESLHKTLKELCDIDIEKEYQKDWDILHSDSELRINKSMAYERILSNILNNASLDVENKEKVAELLTDIAKANVDAA